MFFPVVVKNDFLNFYGDLLVICRDPMHMRWMMDTAYFTMHKTMNRMLLIFQCLYE